MNDGTMLNAADLIYKYITKSIKEELVRLPVVLLEIGEKPNIILIYTFFGEELFFTNQIR